MPKNLNGKERTTIYSFSMIPSIMKRVDRSAKKKKIKRSEWLRDAIEQHVERSEAAQNQ